MIPVCPDHADTASGEKAFHLFQAIEPAFAGLMRYMLVS